MNDNLELLEQRIDAIPAPTFDFAAVRARALREPGHADARRKFISGALVLVILPALAAAAVHFIPLQVTHRVGNWQLFGPSRTFMHPTAANFFAATREAPYRVVWPVGVPRTNATSTLTSVASEVFIVTYSCPDRGDKRFRWIEAAIIPRNFKAVNPKLADWFESQLRPHAANIVWDVRDESVFLGADCLTFNQLKRIRDATIGAAGAQR